MPHHLLSKNSVKSKQSFRQASRIILTPNLRHWKINSKKIFELLLEKYQSNALARHTFIYNESTVSSLFRKNQIRSSNFIFILDSYQKCESLQMSLTRYWLIFGCFLMKTIYECFWNLIFVIHHHHLMYWISCNDIKK